MAHSTSEKPYVVADSNPNSDDGSSPPAAKRRRTGPMASSANASSSQSRKVTQSDAEEADPDTDVDMESLEMREPTMRVSNHGQGLPKGLRVHHAVVVKDGKETWISPAHFHEYSYVVAGYMGLEEMGQLRDLMQSDGVQKIGKLYTAIKGRNSIRAKPLFDEYLSGDILRKLASLKTSELLEGKDLKLKLGLTSDQSLECAYAASFIVLVVRMNHIFHNGTRSGTLIPGFAASFDDDVNFTPKTESLWRAFMLLRLFAFRKPKDASKAFSF